MSSPVQLANYRIKKLNFEITADFQEFDIAKAAFDLNVDYELFGDNEDESKHKVDLYLELIPSTDKDIFLPFEVELIIEGIFLFGEEIDKGERVYHLNVSCPSMLYGVARNLVHQMTGQTNYGNISIPSVQFSEIAKQKSEELESLENHDSEQSGTSE